MKVKLSLKYFFKFIMLTFLMHELHELVHTSIGRLICGCWGERDFNVWGLCTDCLKQNPYAVIATFTGPIFTFAMMYLGASMLATKNINQVRAFGFSLVFANIPLARVLTAMSGGGDEVFGLNKVLSNFDLAWGVGLGIILIVIAYPMYRCWHAISNKRRLLWLSLFLILPTVIDLVVVLGLMNTLLTKGFLSDYRILGSPTLVTLWTISVAILFLASRVNISELVQTPPST